MNHEDYVKLAERRESIAQDIRELEAEKKDLDDVLRAFIQENGPTEFGACKYSLQVAESRSWELKDVIDCLSSLVGQVHPQEFSAVDNKKLEAYITKIAETKGQYHKLSAELDKLAIKKTVTRFISKPLKGE